MTLESSISISKRGVANKCSTSFGIAGGLFFLPVLLRLGSFDTEVIAEDFREEREFLKPLMF